MERIVPYLWFDKEAKEAAVFYTSLFKNSKLLNTTSLPDTPSGDAEMVSFELAGQSFGAISAGPYFKLNPSVSLMVYCENKEEVDALWSQLSKDGSELMPLGEYPFCPYYGWIQDRFGLSWQLMWYENQPVNQKIVPCLLFSQLACGKAEEAARYYATVFDNSAITFVNNYQPGEAVSPEAKVNFLDFTLDGIRFCAMDNGYPADFAFNEAFSFVVNCKDQEEIDYFWEKLSFVPEAEQCGWVKDAYGLSWQIVPFNLETILFSGTDEERARLTQSFLQMKKFDLEELERVRRL